MLHWPAQHGLGFVSLNPNVTSIKTDQFNLMGWRQPYFPLGHLLTQLFQAHAENYKPPSALKCSPLRGGINSSTGLAGPCEGVFSMESQWKQKQVECYFCSPLFALACVHAQRNTKISSKRRENADASVLVKQALLCSRKAVWQMSFVVNHCYSSV